MPPEALGLGVDLGTSGIRLALINHQGEVRAELASPYPAAFTDPRGWRAGLEQLGRQLPAELRAAVAAIAIDGTSGTLLLCGADGAPAPGALGMALPYHQACPQQAALAAALAGPAAAHTPAASASGSLARALQLLEQATEAALPGPWLLRHQADWLMGWLLGDWRWGEEGNNLRLGWDLQAGRWLGAVARQPWSDALPQVCASGSVLGLLGPEAAGCLGLPPACRVVAGSTDASAAVLAADPQPGDGVAVLGTTLVLKQFCPQPLQGPGISCQRVAGQWLVGGASNAGAGVLRQFFSDEQLAELSRQIDPRWPSGLHLRPLPRPGERFPVDDPALPPILEPRPVSDALYLQGLLEGLAAIEQAGWQRLQQLGAPPVQRVLSLGGGARNPQWRALRQRQLGLPVLNRPQCTAAQGMARLALSCLNRP
ncbi:MAG: FGGY-family carbohydrate kinase [Prochlorococcaceae cyanobacterium]